MKHRRIAVQVFLVAFTLDFILGTLYAADEHIPLWHGLYCTYMTAVTVGGDVTPTGFSGHLIILLAGILVIPLAAASLSFLSTFLGTLYMDVIKGGMAKEIHTERERVARWLEEQGCDDLAHEIREGKHRKENDEPPQHV